MDLDLACNLVKLTTDFEDRLDAICARFGPYAEGWDKGKLKHYLVGIRNSVLLRDNRVISMQKGRKIATSARQLLNDLDGALGHDADFMRTLLALEALAGSIPDRHGRGGDKRSGERTRDSSAFGEFVKVYNHAHAKPGFSKGGPLTQFVGDVCALLGVEEKSDEAIRGEFNRLRRKTTSRRKSVR